MSFPRFTRKRAFLWITIAIIAAFLIPIATQFTLQPSQLWDLPLVGKTILIDAGHGGKDAGASSKDGLQEKEITLKIASYLQEQLEQAGAYVVMTRDEDEELSDPEAHKLGKRKAQDLARRVKMVSEVKADLVISIHLNSFPDTSVKGAQAFYNPLQEENKKLAEAIQAEMSRNLPNAQKAAKGKNDVYLLKESPVPTSLVEVGFLSNPEEATLLASDGYQKKLSTALYYGILEYYTGAKQTMAYR
ncbi:N-acetylmuramoyl-L-alanine amidase CwlD [Risungbinella massiliensis]|uniref:N-acetylmuramoyl-L-alanine amidase CwlD n=1 Tax=Risungbinella massiliensis TaxID=1329796 RepID=UPI0005CC7D20|nr:N-acetylmuramoyl-L-alanine amidase CwlD [Risungbinella massiliensis]